MNNQEQKIHTELLVIRCLRGETDAFEPIVAQWQSPMLAFALRYLGNENDALDVVQEAWTAIIKGLHKLQSPSLFVPWMFRILTNKCIDRLRIKRINAQSLENVDLPSMPPETLDINESLNKAVEQLSDEYKTLVLLRFGQGLSTEQIAAILNIPEGTVRSRMHRTLVRLREILGEPL